MKTLKTAIIAAALLMPFGQASADSDSLRERLSQARQQMNQEFQAIDQESRLFQATARTLPAIQSVNANRPVVSIADLSLPGKITTNVLVTKTANPTSSNYSCALEVDFLSLFSTPARAAK